MNKEYGMDFKLVCYYRAKTEEYDRIFTDLRCKYDSTSAFVVGYGKTQSNAYALQLYKRITKIISSDNFQKICQEYSRYPTQWWIDMYYHLLENGEMEEVEEMMTRDERKYDSLPCIKNPFA